MSTEPRRRLTSRHANSPLTVRFKEQTWADADLRAANEGRELNEVLRDLAAAYGFTDPKTGTYEWLPRSRRMTLFEELGGLDSAPSGTAMRKVLLPDQILYPATDRAVAEIEPAIIEERRARLGRRSPGNVDPAALSDDRRSADNNQRFLSYALRALLTGYAEGRIDITLRPAVIEFAEVAA